MRVSGGRGPVLALALATALGACASGPGSNGDPPASQPPFEFTSRDVATMMEVVGYFAGRTRVGQMICLSLVDDDYRTHPAPNDLVWLAEERWPHVTADDCPRTYARMITPIDAQGRPVVETPPPGHIDPQRLGLGRPEVADDGTSWLMAEVLEGTGGARYDCAVPADASMGEVRCRLRTSWIS